MDTKALDVIDTAGIAKMIGLSYAHTRNRVVKMEGFPRPAINLSQKVRAWDRDEVIAFFKRPKRRR